MRDAALEQVYGNTSDLWKTRVNAIVNGLTGSEVTGEDIRMACERSGVKPHHPNAWGSIISNLKRKGRLIPTGRYVNMKGPKSNARKTEVYYVK
jgi:hypothetical protein